MAAAASAASAAAAAAAAAASDGCSIGIRDDTDVGDGDARGNNAEASPASILTSLLITATAAPVQRPNAAPTSPDIVNMQ